MSVDRLAGSGTAGADTEPARKRGAQRRRTGRRPGTSAGAPGGTAPGQAGEAPAGPEPNVTLLGQEAVPGTPAGTQVPAAADAHPAEATTTEAAPPTDAAVAEAAPTTTEPAATGATTSGAVATTEAATTEPAASVTAATSEAAPASDGVPPAPADAGLFARYTRDYVSGHEGQQIMILRAGCTTAGGDLGVGALREAGADIAVSLIDDDQPVTRAALGLDKGLAGCVNGDLRTVPLPPRSCDIVLCALLLQRIKHAELVLDRLVAAIKPGGLLLLRFSDRDSGGGFLDRVMPLVARGAVWRKRRPGRPGPYPAVYERLSSARGVQAYALMRELVIAERQALGGLAGGLAEPRGFLAAQKLVAWLSRGRLTAAHEELLYVLRKPEDRFARIL
jgi:SAM-dependent methyltransferase